ncbi:MAG: hypothetical protein ACLQIQ_12765 [Beijerinckiaceae bacterium]
MVGDAVVALFFNLAAQQKEGESDAKAHDGFDCSGARAGSNDFAGQRAESALHWSRLHPRADEREPDNQKGGM